MLPKIAALAAAVIILGIATSFHKKSKAFSAIMICMIPVCAFLLIWFTLLSRGDADTTPNYIPFSSYIRILQVRWLGWGEYIAGGILGNVLLFVPVGMIIANLIKSKRPYLVSGMIGFALSLAIEITQLTTACGSFEADDILNNTWGAVIGCSIALVLIRKNRNLTGDLRALTPLLVYLGLYFAVCFVPIIKEVFRR